MFNVSGLLFVYFLSSFWLNYNIITEKAIKIPSYLISFVFIILALPLVHLGGSWQIALSIFLLICIYVEIIGIPRVGSNKKMAFKTGFFLGCLVLLDNSFLAGYPIICVSLIYYNQFDWRHFLIQLIGMFYPLGLWHVIGLNFNLNGLISMDLNDMALFYQEITCLVVMCFLLMLSGRELYYNYYKKSENSKKAFNLLFIMVVLVSMYSIIFNSVKFLHLLILPFTIIIANYLIYMKYKKFRTFLLGLLLITFMLKFLTS